MVDTLIAWLEAHGDGWEVALLAWGTEREPRREWFLTVWEARRWAQEQAEALNAPMVWSDAGQA